MSGPFRVCIVIIVSLLLIVLLPLGTALVVSAKAPTRYHSTGVIQFVHPAATFTNRPSRVADKALVAAQVEVLRSPTTSFAATQHQEWKQFGEKLSTDQFNAALTVNGGQESIVRITFEHRRPEIARAGAQAVLSSYTESHRTRALLAMSSRTRELEELRETLNRKIALLEKERQDTQLQREDLRAQLLKVQSRLDQLAVDGADEPQIVELVPPIEPLEPLPDRAIYMRWGMAGGLILAVVILLIWLAAARGMRRAGIERLPAAQVVE